MPRHVFEWFLAYGFALLPLAALTTGMAEGPFLTAAWMCSPLSLVPYLAAFTPIFWGVFGDALGRRLKRRAITMLVVHYLAAPAAMYANRRFGSIADDWRRLTVFMRWEDGAFLAVLIAPYLIGPVQAWRLVRRL